MFKFLKDIFKQKIKPLEPQENYVFYYNDKIVTSREHRAFTGRDKAIHKIEKALKNNK